VLVPLVLGQREVSRQGACFDHFGWLYSGCTDYSSLIEADSQYRSVRKLMAATSSHQYQISSCRQILELPASRARRLLSQDAGVWMHSI